MNWLITKLLKFTGSQKYLSVQLDITNACNLNCSHCYQPRVAGDSNLSLGEWREILDQYSRLADKLCLKPHFGISGGEPTLSPLFIPILEELNSRWPGVGITVLTNGTSLSGEVVSAMKRFGVIAQISVDGPDAARHDVIRGSGNFDRAMKGLKALNAASVDVRLQAVLSRKTAAWAPEFFSMAATSGASAMNFTRFVPQGNGKALHEAGKDSCLTAPELKAAYQEILAASRKTSIPTATNLPLFTLLSPDLGAHGKAGFQGLIIDCRGNLKVTSRADFKLGNILEQGLENLFLGHPIMKALRSGDIEECGTCRYYDRCGGDRNASYVAYGSFLKKDPGCWL